MRRIAATGLCLLFLCAAWGAQAAEGRSYQEFEELYAENIQFLNDNLNRHMLPLVIVSEPGDKNDGGRVYRLYGDTLSLTLITDGASQLIDTCRVVLTAPQGMEYGNALYNDFATSGYHCYALQMAMASGDTPYERYQLVEESNRGLAGAGEVYTAQVGVYAMTCTNLNGSVTIDFENTTILHEETQAPDAEPEESAPPNDDGGPEPSEEEDEEHSLLGMLSRPASIPVFSI